MTLAEAAQNTSTDFLDFLRESGVDAAAIEGAAFNGAAEDIEAAMPPASPAETVTMSQDLKTLRLLTEVNHLRRGKLLDGTYPPELLEGVLENLITKVQEDAMSNAVSHSYQPAAEVRTDAGELRRTFLWKGLGRTALEVAESGYTFHSTDAAFRRVGVEVKEAVRSCDELQPGTIQCFISPKMSKADASHDVAKLEHLSEEDAVRTYWADTDATGRVVGRRMQSLLVRDIPLDAWVRMFKDPHNIFGKSIPVEHEDSALSVMEAFSHLDMPEDALPEGPVSIVAAVIPYIRDQKARESVERQVVKYREDQENLRKEAEITAREWLKFDQALEASLDAGIMSDEVRRVVMIFQSDWSPESQVLLKAHERGSGYRMSVALAAHLEQAWQKAYLGEVAAAVGDERALKNVDHVTAHRLKENAQQIRQLQRGGARPEEIAAMRAHQLRDVVRSNVRAGGGCNGPNEFEFSRDGVNAEGSNGVGGNEVAAGNGINNAQKRSEGIGEISVGVCRTDGCPSRPGKTRVGGCSVCLKYCQPLWNIGKNPEDIYTRINPPVREPSKKAGEKQYIGTFKPLIEKPEKAKAEDKMRVTEKETGKVALAGVG